MLFRKKKNLNEKPLKFYEKLVKFYKKPLKFYEKLVKFYEKRVTFYEKLVKFYGNYIKFYVETRNSRILFSRLYIFFEFHTTGATRCSKRILIHENSMLSTWR